MKDKGILETGFQHVMGMCPPGLPPIFLRLFRHAFLLGALTMRGHLLPEAKDGHVPETSVVPADRVRQIDDETKAWGRRAMFGYSPDA